MILGFGLSVRTQVVKCVQCAQWCVASMFFGCWPLDFENNDKNGNIVLMMSSKNGSSSDSVVVVLLRQVTRQLTEIVQLATSNGGANNDQTEPDRD